MSFNQALIEAVTPIVGICVPDLYSGEASEYCTFNYTESGAGFGDDVPHAALLLVQLHYFLPLRENPLAKRRALRDAILAMGGTAPVITPATDELGQHYIFEFEYLEGY